MFAAIDGNEALTNALIGAVLGGLGGGAAAFFTYLTRKSDAQTQAEWEARERARIDAQGRDRAGTAKRMPGWFLLFALLAIVAGILVVNPSLLAPLLPAGRNPGEPGATSRDSLPSVALSDYGRYRDTGPIRIASDQNASGGVVIGGNGLTLLKQTDQIPCRVGETWGIRIHSASVTTNRVYTVRKEVHHPPIKEPDGSVRTTSANEFKLQPGTEQFCGWYFLKGYEHEMVAGEWTIVVFIDNVEVARKAFQIQK
jgi:hypothetical protein